MVDRQLDCIAGSIEVDGECAVVGRCQFACAVERIGEELVFVFDYTGVHKDSVYPPESSMASFEGRALRFPGCDVAGLKE